MKEKILKELKINARRSDHEIAKRLKCTQPTVSRYREYMERKKIIWGYTTVANTGEQNVMCLWKTEPLGLQEFKKIIRGSELFNIELCDIFQIIDSEYTLYTRYKVKTLDILMAYIRWLKDTLKEKIVGMPRIITIMHVICEEGIKNPKFEDELVGESYKLYEKLIEKK